MKRTLCAAALAAVGLAAAGCGLLAGLEDNQLAPGAGGGGTTGGAGGEGGLQRLAEGQSLPHALAVDGTHVYWATEGKDARGVWRVPRDGGAPAQLVALDNPTVDNPAEVEIGIAVDTDNVYWTEDSGDGSCTSGDSDYRQDKVRGVAKAGGDPFELWSDCPHTDPFGIAVDGQYAFFSVVGSRDIVRVRKGTLEEATLAGDEQDPYALALDGANVFWTLRTDWDGAVRTTEKAGEGDQPEDVFRDGEQVERRPNALAVDETDIYWVDDGRVRAKSKADGSTEIRDLVDGSGALPAIALDVTHVYWTNASDSTILRVAKQGGPVEELARDQNDPEAIAVDDTGVYWANFGRGDIVKLRKPFAP